MDEIKTISKLLSATGKVFENMRVFEDEKQIKKYIISSYKSYLGDFSFKGDIVSGERSAVGEGDATERKIKKGDSIILDLLPRKNGVCSDVTRTFFVGAPSEIQRETYEKVKFALNETKKILKSGVRANEIYEFMKNSLKPYEKTFFHHAGHKIGFKRLMQPQFLPEKTAKLQVGDIVTLEPGIYMKNEFGVRLENDYLITESGCEKLFDYPLDIEKFIL